MPEAPGIVARLRFDTRDFPESHPSITETPNLAIDNLRIEAKPGETILQAARAAGIEIPTLCHLEGFEAGASCMVCAVKQSMMTSQNGVVAAGRAIRPELKPVGSVVEGKVVDAEMRDFIPDAGTSATMFSDRRS